MFNVFCFSALSIMQMGSYYPAILCQSELKIKWNMPFNKFKLINYLKNIQKLSCKLRGNRREFPRYQKINSVSCV